MLKADVEFEWISAESLAADRVAEIEGAGGSVSDSGQYLPRADEARDYASAGFEPLTLIAGAVTASYLLKAIDKVWRNRGAGGGVVVDTRAGKLRVRQVPTMKSGQLIVIEASGSKVFEEGEATEAGALMKSVLETIGHRGEP
jgi:hypothetical protein